MRVAVIGTVAKSLLGFRRSFMQALIAEGAVVYAFAMNFDEVTRAEIKGLGVIPVDYELSRSGLNPLSDLKNSFRLSRVLLRLKVDVVFSYFAKPVIFGTFAAVMANVRRRVGMIEGLGYAFTEDRPRRSLKKAALKTVQVALYRIALKRLDCVVFLNSDDREDLVYKHNLCVKSNIILGGIGVDLDRFSYSPAPDKELNFIFIGRLLAEKGILDFISAARLVKANFPKTTFTILGKLDTSSPGSLTQDELDKHINSELICYPGHVDDVCEWIRRSSVFVLPSYYREGVPRSTQEAMALGRAVITTDMPGCRDTVVDGCNGFLVPPWAPEAIAQKMEFFVCNPEQVNLMGIESRRIAVAKFDEKEKNRVLLNLIFDHETIH